MKDIIAMKAFQAMEKPAMNPYVKYGLIGGILIGVTVGGYYILKELGLINPKPTVINPPTPNPQQQNLITEQEDTTGDITDTAANNAVTTGWIIEQDITGDRLIQGLIDTKHTDLSICMSKISNYESEMQGALSLIWDIYHTARDYSQPFGQSQYYVPCLVLVSYEKQKDITNLTVSMNRFWYLVPNFASYKVYYAALTNWLIEIANYNILVDELNTLEGQLKTYKSATAMDYAMDWTLAPHGCWFYYMADNLLFQFVLNKKSTDFDPESLPILGVGTGVSAYATKFDIFITKWGAK